MTSLFQEPIAVVAPHLICPEVNGADISMERVARYLSSHAPFTDLIGCNAVRRYRAGELEEERPFVNSLRPRWKAAIRTLLHRSHYTQERFNTPAIRDKIAEQLSRERYGIILASYLATVSLLPASLDARCFIWTHNDEFKWFEELADSSVNAIGRAAARSSLRWLYRNVPSLATRGVLIHVSESDREGFLRVVPDHRNIVVAVGTDIDAVVMHEEQAAPERIVLSFVGSLGVRMAWDALNYFHDRFESVLRNALGVKLEIRVIGSNPLPQVQHLCHKNGWSLYADVSDHELSRLLGESTFTILPFAYATGAKLKLVRSLGSGVPFLSTLPPRPAAFMTPPGCCFSNDPNDWAKAIRRWQVEPERNMIRQQLLAVAKNYSWPVVVAKIAESIQQFPS